MTPSSNKRPRGSANDNNSYKNTREELAVQDGIYAAEKFSDSFFISHVINLLVAGEYFIHLSGDTR